MALFYWRTTSTPDIDKVGESGPIAWGFREVPEVAAVMVPERRGVLVRNVLDDGDDPPLFKLIAFTGAWFRPDAVTEAWCFFEDGLMPSEVAAALLSSRAAAPPPAALITGCIPGDPMPPVTAAISGDESAGSHVPEQKTYTMPAGTLTGSIVTSTTPNPIAHINIPYVATLPDGTTVALPAGTVLREGHGGTATMNPAAGRRAVLKAAFYAYLRDGRPSHLPPASSDDLDNSWSLFVEHLDKTERETPHPLHGDTLATLLAKREREVTEALIDEVSSLTQTTRDPTVALLEWVASKSAGAPPVGEREAASTGPAATRIDKIRTALGAIRDAEDPKDMLDAAVEALAADDLASKP